MKNSYEIRGDVTAIFLTRKDGTVLETLIDTEDLPKVQKFNNTWYARYSPTTKSCYVAMSVFLGGKRSSICMHRIITDCPDDFVVDHINHDTLDNRKLNLRIVTKGQNNQNKIGAHKNNKCGVQGVFWVERMKKWRAKIRVDKKNVHLGYFDDITEAELAVKQAKAKYMPYSLEALSDEGAFPISSFQ